MKSDPRLEPGATLGMALLDGAEAAVRVGQRAMQRALRQRRGKTLRPGPNTPLWNELAAAVRPWLRQHGEQAKLARLLGIPRQRVFAYFEEKTQMPDAERTLLLLAWLHERRAGRATG